MSRHPSGFRDLSGPVRGVGGSPPTVPTVRLELTHSKVAAFKAAASTSSARSAWYRGQDSNLHWTGSEPAASASWATPACDLKVGRILSWTVIHLGVTRLSRAATTRPQRPAHRLGLFVLHPPWFTRREPPTFSGGVLTFLNLAAATVFPSDLERSARIELALLPWQSSVLPSGPRSRSSGGEDRTPILRFKAWRPAVRRPPNAPPFSKPHRDSNPVLQGENLLS